MNGRWGGRDSELERTLYNPQEIRERAIVIPVKHISEHANFLQRWGERLRGKSESKQDAKTDRLKSRIAEILDE